MAHPTEVKAQAAALLILGNRVNHVARSLGLPRQTISRWNAELDEIIDRCVANDLMLLPELQKQLGINVTNRD